MQMYLLKWSMSLANDGLPSREAYAYRAHQLEVLTFVTRAVRCKAYQSELLTDGMAPDVGMNMGVCSVQLGGSASALSSVHGKTSHIAISRAAARVCDMMIAVAAWH